MASLIIESGLTPGCPSSLEHWQLDRTPGMLIPGLSPPTEWALFCDHPIGYLARRIYESNISLRVQAPRHPPPPPSDPTKIRLVCISDTHNILLSPSLVPNGDILIHAGDLSQNGSLEEVQTMLNWLATFPHDHKIVIGGNHDTVLADPNQFPKLDFHDLTYLCETLTNVTVRSRKLSIYGTPWTPKFGNFAFQYTPHPHPAPPWTTEARSHVDCIPLGIDILVTHGPGRGHLDLSGHFHSGCIALAERLRIVQPRVHVFGHIHAARGIGKCNWNSVERTWVGGLMLRAWIGRVTGAWRAKETIMVNAACEAPRRGGEARPAIVLDI